MTGVRPDAQHEYRDSRPADGRLRATLIPIDRLGDIREGVRRICERFPNEYWVKIDHEAAYPTEFVDGADARPAISAR